MYLLFLYVTHWVAPATWHDTQVTSLRSAHFPHTKCLKGTRGGDQFVLRSDVTMLAGRDSNEVFLQARAIRVLAKIPSCVFTDATQCVTNIVPLQKERTSLQNICYYHVVPFPTFVAGHPNYSCGPKFTRTVFVQIICLSEQRFFNLSFNKMFIFYYLYYL